MRRLLLVLLLACQREKKPPAPLVKPSASTPATVAPAERAPQGRAAPPTALPSADGGACHTDVGPLALDFVGAPTIIPLGADANVIGNDQGAAHVVLARAAKPGAARMSSLPCAAARGQFFCPDAAGKIKSGDKTIAESRAGTRVAAAEIGGHAIVAYLRDKKTSEGTTQFAEVWSDDGVVQALSDEGNGATFVDLAARDGEVLALTIDAHMGMTPIHARVLEWKGKLALGADVVLTVQGNAEAHTAGAIATKHDKGPSFALVPLAEDILGFGVATIRIDEPPKVDAPVLWSLYENGLDPAPIAATHNTARALVVRVRPSAKDPKAPRVTELGEIDAKGAFVSFGVVHGESSSVAIAGDASGAWIAYADEHATWIEHRACP